MSNDLEQVRYKNAINKASWALSVIEQRIILTAIAHAGNSVTSKELYHVSATDLVQLGSGKKAVYTQMKQAVQTLFQRYFLFEENLAEDRKRTTVVHWIQRATYDDAGVISLRFTEDLVPYLTNLKEQFTKYGLLELVGVDSQYATRIYALLKQFESTGLFVCKLDDFREMLQLGDMRYTDIRRFVLDVTKKQINNGERTTIKFSYEPMKTSRSVTGLKFRIWPKTNRQPPDIDNDEPVFDWSMTEKQAKMFADQLTGLNKKANGRLSKIYSNFDGSQFIEWLYVNWSIERGTFANTDKKEIATAIALLLRSRQDFVKKCYEPFLKHLGFKPAEVSD